MPGDVGPRLDHTTQLIPATIALCDRLGYRRAPAYDFDGGVHFGLEPGMIEVITYCLHL